MAHRKTFRDSSGNRCPSVTTVLREFKCPDPLMYWSWNVAYEPLSQAVEILEQVNASKRVPRKKIKDFLEGDPMTRGHYRRESMAAAYAGTFAHDLVEIWIKGRKGERLSLARKKPSELAKTYNYPVEIAEKAYSSFQAFVEWAHSYKLQVLATEQWIGVDGKHLASWMKKNYNMHPEDFGVLGFHGTIDCIAQFGTKGEIILLDWKTSKSVYPDHLLQLAGYGLLWKITRPDQPLNAYHLVRFDKEAGGFHHHGWSDLETSERMFLRHLASHQDLKEVKKKCK